MRPSCLWACLLLLLCAAAAFAQSSDVTISINPGKVGLGGYIRRGNWTPLQFNIDNRFSEPRRVRCTWSSLDADGETVIAESIVTLTPSRPQSVWLYSDPRQVKGSGSATKEAWQLQVIDDTSRKVLASETLLPFQAEDRIIGSRVRVVGLMGTMVRGLQPYTREYTQFEPTRFIPGLDLKSLPDRWYGLSLLEALIWTPRGGDPGSPTLTPESADALREWVRRGGHLVISLPALGETWAGSPLKDLMPPVTVDTQRGVSAPSCLGVAATTDPLRLDLKTFELQSNPEPGRDVTVIHQDDAGRPLVVAWQYGLGRVTLIGVDLNDAHMVPMDLPNGATFWGKIFGWRDPCLSQRVIDDGLDHKPKLFLERGERSNGELDTLVIPPMISMAGAVATPVLLAILFFGGYWLAAGPVGFGVAKARGLSRHAWLGFVCVVGICSAVAWAGASMIRIKNVRINHFTVMDIDATTGQVHAHSWLSLFAPTHSRVEVIIDPAHSAAGGGSGDTPLHNTIAAPGLPEADSASFIDPERYSFDSTDPGRVALPYRATAKQLEIDFYGDLLKDEKFVRQSWGLPVGRIKLEGGWPTGTLVHQLPDTLKDVVFIYSPGALTLDGHEESWVLGLGDWKPGEEIRIPPPPPMVDSISGLGDLTPNGGTLGRVDLQAAAKKGYWRLARREVKVDPTGHDPDRDVWSGFLPDILSKRPGDGITDVTGRASDDRIKQCIDLLSFYDALPPPENVGTNKTALGMGTDAPYGCMRTTGREMDLSALLGLRRVIILGHLDKGQFPIPMSVDGATTVAEGWTVVRWIAPVE